MRRATVVVKHDSVKRRVAEMSELDTELIFRALRDTARVASYAIGREVVSIRQDGGAFDDVRELVAEARGATGVRVGGSRLRHLGQRTLPRSHPRRFRGDLYRSHRAHRVESVRHDRRQSEALARFV
jgi:hypothetical protein